MRGLKKYVFSIVVTILLVIAGTAVVQAVSISQGYLTSDKNIVVGMAASLSSNSSDSAQYVERTSTKNVPKFVGIVTTLDASLLTLTNKNASVYVVREGTASAYVSSVNGSVSKGDFVTASPFLGVLMKADNNETKVLGTALESFDPSKAEQKDFEGPNGQEKTDVTALKVELNPRSIAGADESKKPFLILFGQSLTGKDVSQWQVFAAIVIFMILLIAEGSIIYGAVHSTITALGRNPLAKKVLYKHLLQVFLLVLLVFAFGLSTIYVILWA